MAFDISFLMTFIGVALTIHINFYKLYNFMQLVKKSHNPIHTKKSAHGCLD